MIVTIQCDTAARADTLRDVLAQAATDEVALAFPLGAACALADPAELDALRKGCELLGKQVVVVGGDSRLRALAVAAGFAAATSVEEWETSQHKAVRRRSLSLSPVLRKRPDAAPTGSRVRMVRQASRVDRDGEVSPGDLYESIGDDPPTYVADLMAADETLSPVERQSQIPTIPLQRGRITRRLEESQREAAEAAAVDRAQQDYEDHITRTIRKTGGPARQAGQTSPPDLQGCAGDENAAPGLSVKDGS